MLTPETVDVERRALHESQVPPGTICRRHYQPKDDGEIKTSGWFAVVSEPVDEWPSPQVKVVWLTGEKAGREEMKYLGDMGVLPPYRVTCERHELQIPSKYIDGKMPDGVLKRLFT